MKCVKCKINYPEGIVNEAFMMGQYFKLCGICYELIVGFELHGEQATLVRDMAKEYRAKHPELKPEV